MKSVPRYPWPLFMGGLLLAVLSFAFACKQEPSESERQAATRAAQYLVKDSSLYSQFRITALGLEMLDADTAKPERQAEALIYWEEVPLFQKMVFGLSTDSLLQLYSKKGSQHWTAQQFANLPETPPTFHYDPKAALPLKGLRIALDPGHVGGSMDYAQYLEEKFVRIRPDENNLYTEEVGFCEGNLALGTALILAEKLRAQGAEVLLTREQEGLNAFGMTFEAWLDQEVRRHEAWLHRNGHLFDPPGKDIWRLRCAGANYVRDFNITGKDADYWRKKATLAQIHRIAFLKAEFVKRAQLINDFRPDLTFVIHYNVGANNETKQDGYRKALPENYCMAFLPGSFMAGELKEPGDRLAFAAKLLTDDIPKSQQLCAAVVRAHERILNVPAIVWDERLPYLQNASMRTRDIGVFARNLQLTRLINGPICFGESLLQDNIDEAKALNAHDFTLPSMTTPLPNRIKVVADAYYAGLLDYLSQP